MWTSGVGSSLLNHGLDAPGARDRAPPHDHGRPRMQLLGEKSKFTARCTRILDRQKLCTMAVLVQKHSQFTMNTQTASKTGREQ